MKSMHIKLEYIWVYIMIWFGEQWISGSSSNIIVTLNPKNQIYVNNGGTLSLTCDVNQNTGFSSVIFTMESDNKVIITNINSCSYIKADPSDFSTYNVTCTGQKTFTMVKYGITNSDHNKRWNCLLNSATVSEGPCRGSSNPCVSSDVTVIIIVPVTTVQLTNGSGQVLHSSVNIVRGESTAIICTTAPSGSRPRALFQWYYRQGNQSPVLIVDQSISTTPDPITVPGQSDILISYSTWRLTGNASYHNMYIYCQAQDENNTGNYAKTDEIQLNIVYPPVVQLYSSQSAYNVTEGMQDFVFICNILESNPQPQTNSYSWYHKRSIIQGQTSYSYTLRTVQRSDAGEYMCTARNFYGYGTSNFLDLIVQYPSSITVILAGSTQLNQTAILICGAVGVPADTAFYPWIQRWRDVVIRTGLQGTANSTHSILTLERISLESMGTYICTANNGIMGISGTLNQTGSESLQVKGKPNVLIDTDKFVGEIGLSVKVSIPFYSDPVIISFVIQRENRTVMNTSRTMTYLSNEIVNYQFYNIAIQLDAQKANFVIQNVTALDFDNYTLVLTNSFGSTSFKFLLDPFVTPEKPFNFHPTNVQEKQLSLRWQSGYNGGHTQTFIVEISLDNITWNNVSQVSTGNMDGWFTTVIENLIPGSDYYLRLYAYNINGRGDFADVQLVIRMLKDCARQSSLEVGASAGIGVGGVVLGLITAFVAMTIRRQLKGSKKSCFRSKGKTDDAMHTYSNTEMNPQTVKPIYEELNKGNTEPSVYDKISPLEG